MSLVEAPHRRAAMTGGGAPWTWRGGLEPWELLQSPALHAAVMFVRGKQEGGRRRDEKEKKRSAGKKKKWKKGKFSKLENFQKEK
jgi:hypothetical protein